ncbi:MAG: outer membrane beta-barrel protein [Candidatus Saccharicenans sp.]|nr:outer membrane beta-barrel protein [Candidatus Saccharicenans sp.]
MNLKRLMGVIATILIIFFVTAGNLEALAPNVVGFKMGYTHNQLRGKETGAELTIKKMAINGLGIGLVGNIKINSWLYFQPELLYFQKGGKYDVQVPLPVQIPGFQVNVIDTRSLEYLEIPLLLKVSLPVKFPVQPTFLTGMSFGLKLRGTLENKVNISISSYQFPYIRTEDITSQLKSIEPSYVIGGGFDINLGRSKMSIDQRFSFGLTTNDYETVIPASYFQNIGIPVPQDIVYRIQMYNYVFQLAITFFF